MRKILAAVDSSAVAGLVLATARAVAELFDATAEAINVREDGDETAQAAAERAAVPLRTFEGVPIDTLLSAARDEEVVAIVVGARANPLANRPVGHVTTDLVTSLRKPVVVVPRRASAPRGIERVLVPLEGTRISSEPMAGIMVRACKHGLDVVLLHIRDDRSIPRFSEQADYEMEAWADEFLARHCACSPRQVRLEVRVGSAGEQIVRAIEETGAHLVALSWSQALAANRARVVQQCLDRSTVPVLLVPNA